MPNGLRPSVPLKITSAISPPRSKALADCSPNTTDSVADVGLTTVGAYDRGHASWKLSGLVQTT